MTEETATKNGAAAGDAPPAAAKADAETVSAGDPTAKIIRQVEHYFGDFNLPRDKFLLEQTQENEGWVSMETMLKFQRLANISKDAAVILAALKAGSDLMEVDEEGSRLRRKPDKPVPEWNEERKKEVAAMTLYIKGFDKENTTLDELLEHFAKTTENAVANITLRQFTDRKTNSKGFKGSVFVTFKDKASAEKFMAEEKVSYKDAELERKWQESYFEEKRQEQQDRKKDRKESKKKVQDAKDEAAAAAAEEKEGEKKDEEFSLPKGAVLHVKGLGESNTREDLREVLEAKFGVEKNDIAFIYYQKGEAEAKLRFQKEGAAKAVLEKIEGDEKKLEVKDVTADVAVLEGEEEEAFLKQCAIDMKDRFKNQKRHGHKRRGGFSGGHGGKRGRR